MITSSTSSDLSPSGEEIAKPAEDQSTNGCPINISPEDRDAVSERFRSKVAKKGDAECWEWKACSKAQGYGRIHLNGKMQSAHRVAYALVNGDVPAHRHVLHTCDNPTCCNPGHLTLGSASENIRDMVKKNRHARGERHGRAKLTSKKAEEIRASEAPLHALSETYGVHPSVISSVRRNMHWKAAVSPIRTRRWGRYVITTYGARKADGGES